MAARQGVIIYRLCKDLAGQIRSIYLSIKQLFTLAPSYAKEYTFSLQDPKPSYTGKNNIFYKPEICSFPLPG
jgi:hypothetical protein